MTHELTTYATMILCVYKQDKKSVAGYTLKGSTKNVFCYENEKNGKCIVAIRGIFPHNQEDIQACGHLITNTLSSSKRYKRDIHFIRSLQLDKSKTLFVGHSLGGAICDQLMNDGVASKCKTLNPAIQPMDVRNSNNTRYYTKGDFLYLLIGRYASHVHVLQNEFDFHEGDVNYPIIFNLWTAHRIQRFIHDYTPELEFQIKEKQEHIKEELDTEHVELPDEHLVQSVVLHKSHFNKDEAVEWIHNHEYKHDFVDETPNEYRFRQINPSIIKTGHYRVRNIPIGDEGFLVMLYK